MAEASVWSLPGWQLSGDDAAEEWDSQSEDCSQIIKVSESGKANLNPKSLSLWDELIQSSIILIVGFRWLPTSSSHANAVARLDKGQ